PRGRDRGARPRHRRRRSGRPCAGETERRRRPQRPKRRAQRADRAHATERKAMKLRHLDHFGIDVANLARAESFYTDVLGMTVRMRLADQVLLRYGDGACALFFKPGRTPGGREQIDNPLGTLHNPGPAYMPVLLALALLGLAILVAAWGGSGSKLRTVGWSEWRHAAAILGTCAFAALALERLGYRLTMGLALAFLIGVVE